MASAIVPTSHDAVLGELRSLLPPDRIITDPAELFVYESDGFTVARARPLAVVFPLTTNDVVAIVKTLGRHGVQIVPRGSGTGLAGGCVAYENGVLVSTARMDRILKIDIDNRAAHVQAGVRNTALTDALALSSDEATKRRSDEGRETSNQQPATCNFASAYHFAPDPSSQRASTIGGNASTNAGGIHTLKDFVTSTHIIGIEMVLADGSVVTFGGRNGCCEHGPFDLPGLICGHEGTFGIITSLWVRLTPKATSFRTLVATFATTADACNTVSDIIGAGYLPAAMEMMDGAMIRCVEDAFAFGFSRTAAALVLIEIDGIDELLDGQLAELAAICRSHNPISLEDSRDPDRRALLWKARKSAFGAIGRISKSYFTQDACVPRSMLAQVLDKIARIAGDAGVPVTNVFHAGDGNVHPIFLFDERDPEQVKRTLTAAFQVLLYCMEIGGTLTGEHGVGVEKIQLMPCMFDEPTLGQFVRLKHAFDPEERINAGKVVPSDKVVVTMIKPSAK